VLAMKSSDVEFIAAKALELVAEGWRVSIADAETGETLSVSDLPAQNGGGATAGSPDG